MYAWCRGCGAHCETESPAGNWNHRKCLMLQVSIGPERDEIAGGNGITGNSEGCKATQALKGMKLQGATNKEVSFAMGTI